jgi:hypothetical protein
VYILFCTDDRQNDINHYSYIGGMRNWNDRSKNNQTFSSQSSAAHADGFWLGQSHWPRVSIFAWYQCDGRKPVFLTHDWRSYRLYAAAAAVILASELRGVFRAQVSQIVADTIAFALKYHLHIWRRSGNSKRVSFWHATQRRVKRHRNLWSPGYIRWNTRNTCILWQKFL